MSSGAEFAVLAAPVGAVAVGALALAAGVVVVGGVALVGVGRLGVAAGSYVADRMRERAQVCAGEYARFQQLRAQALASKPPQKRVIGHNLAATMPAPALGAPSWPTFHQDHAVAETIAARLSADLSAQQSRYAERLRLVEQRAQLSAALAIESDRLAPHVAEQARQALATDDLTAVGDAIKAVGAAVAQYEGQALQVEQAALRAHHAEVTGLLAVVSDPGLRSDLLDWQRRLNGMLASADIGAIRNRLRDGALLVERCRTRHEIAQAEMQSAELAEVWGLRQAVGGLFSDLETLERAGLLAADAEQLAVLKELSAQYDVLETAPFTNLASLRTETGKIKTGLRQLQQSGLRRLNGYYQQRLIGEVEQSLNAIRLQDKPFDTVERATLADGSVSIKARQGKRRLNVWVRLDGKLKYHAHGFGDEGCLDAVYSLFDQLIDRGVQIDAKEPQLTNQVSVALHVIEAMKQLEHYGEDEITVREDADAVVIEASKSGSGAFQRRRISVDEHGKVHEERAPVDSQSPLTGVEAYTEAVQKRTAKVKQRHPALEEQRRKQRQGL